MTSSVRLCLHATLEIGIENVLQLRCSLNGSLERQGAERECLNWMYHVHVLMTRYLLCGFHNALMLITVFSIMGICRSK